MVPPGNYVIAFMARDYGAPAMIIANIYVDGQLVAWTGAPGWKATDVPPTVGWDSNFRFNDASWTDLTFTCPNGAWANTVAVIQGTDGMAIPVWFPNCATGNNVVFFRYKLTINGTAPAPVVQPSVSLGPVPTTIPNSVMPVATATGDPAASAITASQIDTNTIIGIAISAIVLLAAVLCAVFMCGKLKEVNYRQV